VICTHSDACVHARDIHKIFEAQALDVRIDSVLAYATA
jgi:hypothetical protein